MFEKSDLWVSSKDGFAIHNKKGVFENLSGKERAWTKRLGSPPQKCAPGAPFDGFGLISGTGVLISFFLAPDQEPPALLVT